MWLIAPIVLGAVGYALTRLKCPRCGINRPGPLDGPCDRCEREMRDAR